MGQDTVRIGVVAPGSRLEPAIAEAVRHLAQALYPGRLPELHFTLDLSQEHVERIEQLLKEMKKDKPSSTP